jgi:hypothetical protein
MAEMNHDQSISIYSNLLRTQMKQLVGGFNHLEKYEFVNGKDYPIIPYITENKKTWLKPPTSFIYDGMFHVFPMFSHDFPSKLNLHMAPSWGIPRDGTRPAPGRRFRGPPQTAPACCAASPASPDGRRAPDPDVEQRNNGFYIVFMYF